MALYNDIAASRLAAGRLWTPALSLDLMSRDWSNICRPWNYYMTTQTSGGLAVWADMPPAIEMAWPTFEVDESFDPALEVRLLFSVEAAILTSGAYEIRFHENSAGVTTAEQTVTASWVTYNFEMNFGPAVNMPNGAVVIQCQRKGSAGNDIPGGEVLSLRWLSLEPTFYMQARIVP